MLEILDDASKEDCRGTPPTCYANVEVMKHREDHKVREI